MALKPSSSSRRLFCSASLATVLDVVLADSWIRLPANQNSYHQVLPLLKTDIRRNSRRPYDDIALTAARKRWPPACDGSAVTGCDPPVGREASHDSTSSGR